MFEAYRFFFYCGASRKAKSLSFIFLVEGFSNSCVVPIPKLKGIISLAHSVLLLILPFIRELWRGLPHPGLCSPPEGALLPPVEQDPKSPSPWYWRRAIITQDWHWCFSSPPVIWTSYMYPMLNCHQYVFCAKISCTFSNKPLFQKGLPLSYAHCCIVLAPVFPSREFMGLWHIT